MEADMRGVLSARPANWTARLLVGGELLLVVTTVLLLGSASTLDGTLEAIAAALVLLSIATLLVAIFGERAFARPR
jgi:hypothetical protein